MADPKDTTTGLKGSLRVTYIGHATLLLELGGRKILTDPNFDRRLGGVLRRVSPPGIALGDLPAFDAVLVTHAHMDHLSLESLRALPQDIPIYAPISVAAWLQRRGFPQASGVAPGETIEVGAVRVHAEAATHFVSRYGVDRWMSAASMYLLSTDDVSCFFAGDTSLQNTTHQIADRILNEIGRTLDLALLPIGHAPWWKPGFRRGHLTAVDALTLFERLRARYLIPYHWGSFHHVTSGPFDAIKVLRAALPAYNRSSDVVILDPGKAFELNPQSQK